MAAVNWTEGHDLQRDRHSRGRSAGPRAWAGLFEGDVFVQGALLKYASLFSIDHPLDPGKVLNHASVEAPEYKTLSDGVATLDARGEARVRLPR